MIGQLFHSKTWFRKTWDELWLGDEQQCNSSLARGSCVRYKIEDKPGEINQVRIINLKFIEYHQSEMPMLND